MWEQIMGQAVSNGLWAMLFCALLIYQLTDSRKRENKYQSIIASLSESVEKMDTVSQNVDDMKAMVTTINQKVCCVETISDNIKDIKKAVKKPNVKRNKYCVVKATDQTQLSKEE